MCFEPLPDDVGLDALGGEVNKFGVRMDGLPQECPPFDVIVCRQVFKCLLSDFLGASLLFFLDPLVLIVLAGGFKDVTRTISHRHRMQGHQFLERSSLSTPSRMETELAPSAGLSSFFLLKIL